MKKINLIYNEKGYISNSYDDGEFYIAQQEDKAVIISATFPGNLVGSVNAYVEYNGGGDVIENCGAIDINKHTVELPLDSNYLTYDYLKVGFEVKTSTKEIRFEPLTLEVDEFVNVTGSSAPSPYTISVKVGKVTKLEAKAEPTVTNSGNNKHVVLDFGIPSGKDGVGVETEEGGIILNDRDTNASISKFSSTFGSYNTAGCRGFNIISCEGGAENGEGRYKLDSVDGLTVGDVYSVYFTSVRNYFDLGEIVSIDNVNNVVAVSNYMENEIDGEDYFFVISKPTIGTVDIGQNTVSTGIGNIAVLKGAVAGGTGTKARAKFSRTGGYESVADGYGSVSDGRGTVATRHYQQVHGQYNVIDEERKMLEIVGNGSDDENRSNARSLDKEGNAYYGGNLDVNKSLNVKGNADVEGNLKVKGTINDMNFNYTPVTEFSFEPKGVYEWFEDELPFIDRLVGFSISDKDHLDYEFDNADYILNLPVSLKCTNNNSDILKIKDGKIFHKKKIIELKINKGLSNRNSTTTVNSGQRGDSNSCYIDLSTLLQEQYPDLFTNKNTDLLLDCISTLGLYYKTYDNSTDFLSNYETSLQNTGSTFRLWVYFEDINNAPGFRENINNLLGYDANSGAVKNPISVYLVLNEESSTVSIEEEDITPNNFKEIWDEIVDNTTSESNIFGEVIVYGSSVALKADVQRELDLSKTIKDIYKRISIIENTLGIS